MICDCMWNSHDVIKFKVMSWGIMINKNTFDQPISGEITLNLLIQIIYQWSLVYYIKNLCHNLNLYIWIKKKQQITPFLTIQA